MGNVPRMYPHRPDKHRDPESRYTPADFLGWALRSGWDPGPLPVGVVFTFQGFLTRRLIEQPERFAEHPALAPSNARVFVTADDAPLVAISCLNPGATTMVSQVEHLLFLGDTRRFITIGTAGGLDLAMEIADTAVLTAALRDDGISQHYLAPARYVEPAGDLTGHLRAALAAQGVPTTDRVTWTVPVAYRSTATELAEYTADGVSVVEQEAASLFAVTTARRAESAAAVVISDLQRAEGTAEVEWRDTVKPLVTLLDAAIAAIRDSAG